MFFQIWFFAIISVVLISLTSLVGVATLSIKRKKLQQVFIYLVSFAVGALFGDAFLHLIPEAFRELGIGLNTSLLVLVGIVLFFALEKFVHWQHCHKVDCDEHERPITTMNLIGDGFHNLLDGMLIGASFMASVPLGIATSLAVLAHEIPQEIGDFGVLLHGGFSVKKALFYNFLSALAAMVGVVLTLALGSHIEGFGIFLLPITAGGFIYIAGSDLIPELHHGQSPQKSLKQLISILLGIGVMILLTFLE